MERERERERDVVIVDIVSFMFPKVVEKEKKRERGVSPKIPFGWERFNDLFN